MNLSIKPSADSSSLGFCRGGESCAKANLWHILGSVFLGLAFSLMGVNAQVEYGTTSGWDLESDSPSEIQSMSVLRDSLEASLDGYFDADTLLKEVGAFEEKGLTAGQHVYVSEALSGLLSSLEHDYGREVPEEMSGEDSAVWVFMAQLKITLGAVYEEMGLWTRAMDLYFNVQAFYAKTGIEQGYSRLLNNIANVYFKQGYMDKARFFYDSAVSVNKAAGNEAELFNNYNNLAALDYTRKDYASALEVLAKAMALVDQEKSPESYYLVQANMATIYEQQGKTSLALAVLRDVYAFESKSGQDLSLVSTCLQIAGLYEEEPDSAYLYLRRGLDLAEAMGNQSARFAVQKALFQWLYKQRRYKEACDLSVRNAALKDSMDKADNRVRMENMEASYAIEMDNSSKDLALKQLQIDRLESQRQAILLLAVLFCLLIAMGILYYLYRTQRRLKKRESDLSARQKLLHEQELELLQHKEQSYKDSLEQRNKELTVNALRLMRNNEYIADISQKLQKLLLEMNPKDAAKKNHIRELLVKLRNQGSEGVYNEFQYYFEKVHQSFYQNLLNAYPMLTHKDLRLCAFLKLGLSSKEIAAMTFKEVRSVEMAQYRLRKKMGLDSEQNLVDFFARFS